MGLPYHAAPRDLDFSPRTTHAVMIASRHRHSSLASRQPIDPLMLCHGRDTALRTLALVALLVVGLGLPRLLVICIHADGIGRVEFVHAAGACCAEEPQHAAKACCADHGGLPHASSDGGCEHLD